MNIKIRSYGTKESLDFRNILEGMYRRMGNVVGVEFPDEHTIQLNFDGQFDFYNEYGIHEMTRISPRDESGLPRTSHVLVEINGKSREEIVATYSFPKGVAENHLTGAKDDLMWVLSGNPLGIRVLEYV